MKPDYPVREGRKSAGFGYASDMIHIAVNHDDPRGFMEYLKECGGPDVEVLIDGDIFTFAANHGATECLKALFASGAKPKSGRDLAHYLKVAEKPAWGPRARRLDAAA